MKQLNKITDREEYCDKVKACLEEVNNVIENTSFKNQKQGVRMKMINTTIKEKSLKYGLKKANIETIYFGIFNKKAKK